VGDETCVHARPTVATRHQTGGEDPRGNQRETRTTRLPLRSGTDDGRALAGQLTNKGRAVLPRPVPRAFPVELSPVPVRDSQAVINAQLERETLFAHDSDLKSAEEARDQYRQNTAELVRRLGTPDWKDGVEGVDAEQASGPVAGSEEVAR